MNSLKALVKRVLRDLDAEYKVEISLADFPDIDADNADEALSRGAQFLRRRARDLHEAETELSTIAEQFVDELELVGLSEFGWDSLRSMIEAEQREDKIKGLKMWLETWFLAAAHGRHSALNRLLNDIQLPDFARTLRDRAFTSTTGLRRCDYHLSEPMVSAGISGIELKGEVIPSSETRGRLNLVKLRLAINADMDKSLIETLFADAETYTDRLTLSALRSRWRRISGFPSEDHEPVFTMEEATNLDVAIELILDARGEQSMDHGFSFAQKAVESISLLHRPMEIIEASLTDIPPEVWIVAAERAVLEENRAAFDYCLDAVSAVEGVKEYFWGRYHLARAKGYAAFGESSDTRAKELKTACTNFLYTTELDLAYQCAREAYDLRPDDIEMLLVLGDAIRLWAYEKPISEYRSEVEEILETFYTAFNRDEPACRDAWCHSIVSGLHLLLARSEDAESEQQKWRAFTAAARGVLTEKQYWPCWTALAAASLHLDLERLDLVFARTAHAVDQNLTTLDDLSRALFNAADFEALEEVLDPTISDYSAGINVFLLFTQRDFDASIEQFAKYVITPRYTWAWECCISSAFMLGRENFAIRQSGKYREYWMGFENESDRENAIALDYFVKGQFEKARDTLTQNSSMLSDGSQLSLGFYEIAAGDTEKGLERLSQLALRTKSTIPTTLWTIVTKDWMSTVAEAYGARLPDFAAVDCAFEKRAAELKEEMTPELELQTIASGENPEPASMKEGKALAAVMLALSRQNLAEARRLLDQSRDDLSARDFDLARDFLTAEPEIMASSAEAESAPEEPLPTSGNTQPTEPKIHLFVCAAWFEDHADPLQTHPMFKRWLPEARIWYPDLPAVQVKVDDMFSPGDYEIEIDGVVEASGHIDDSAALYRKGSERLFDQPSHGTDIAEDGLVQFSYPPSNGVLPQLMKLSAQEVLIHRLSECVQAVLRDK